MDLQTFFWSQHFRKKSLNHQRIAYVSTILVVFLKDCNQHGTKIRTKKIRIWSTEVVCCYMVWILVSYIRTSFEQKYLHYFTLGFYPQSLVLSRKWYVNICTIDMQQNKAILLVVRGQERVLPVVYTHVGSLVFSKTFMLQSIYFSVTLTYCHQNWFLWFFSGSVTVVIVFLDVWRLIMACFHAQVNLRSLLMELQGLW